MLLHEPKPSKKRAVEEVTRESLYNPLSTSLVDYFLESKHLAKSCEKIMPPGYALGDLCLGCVGGKGPAFKYLVVHFNRFKKGFLDPAQASESGNLDHAKNYRQGEFVVARVVKGDAEHNVQLTAKPSLVNQDVTPRQIIEGLVLAGEVLSIEKKAIGISIRCETKVNAFCPIEKAPDVRLGVSMAWRVLKKTEKPLTLELEPINASHLSKVEGSPQQVLSVKGMDDDYFRQFDLKMLLRPGTNVDCLIIHGTDSGLVVKFLKCCYGYVLQDHLREPL